MSEETMTKEQEDEFGMELAKADFLKRVQNAADGTIRPGILTAIGYAFETGFKMGIGWRDEP